MISKSNLLINFITVGFWTFVSRIFGFVRDIMFAAFLGSGPIGEAFIIAFSLPNIFRRFFAEGAFNAAFIPMFKKSMGNKKQSIKFSNNTLSMMILILAIFTIVSIIIMPVLVLAMASGFGNDNRFETSVFFGRITFPYIFFVSVSSLFAGILNSYGKFGIVSATPIFLNISLILAMIFSYVFDWEVGTILSISVPISGILQLIVLVQSCRKIGYSPKLNLPKLDAKIKKLMIIALPVVLSGGVIHINLLVGRQIASYYDGAIAWLNYADRLYQLPLGVVGIALGSVLLPKLSEKIQLDNVSEMNRVVHNALKIAFVLILPATVALIILPIPIITVLFERGEFSNIDSKNTASALAIYAFGLPAFVLHKIFTPMFFAKGNTKTPFRIALISMLSNIIVALFLINFVGYLAPVFSTTISSWIMAFALYYESKKIGFYLDRKLIKEIFIILLSTLILVLILLVAEEEFFYLLVFNKFNAIYLFTLISVSSFIYFTILWLLGILKKNK
tara:strand:+ start:70 stop:1584 length:1515 start_codon:yes stop_codon:yes gene_type:complete